MQEIVNIAKQNQIIIHCDEVYRPLFHSLGPEEPENPPSILDFGYEKTISTSSMSKAFSLAGIRLGWIASRSSEIIEACASARDYTLISVSQLDDSVATHALSPVCIGNLLKRNIELAQQNLKDVEDFVRDYEGTATWVRPRAGTTAFIKFSKNGVPERQVLVDGLKAIRAFMEKGFEDVPLLKE